MKSILSLKIENNRIFGLDLFRAVAILIVVMDHGAFLLNSTFLERFPWIRMIDGVELFFVLSGFLIGSMLLKQFSNKKRIPPTDLLAFWKRRWFRTLPNYYLILLVNWFIVNYTIINEDIHQFNFRFLFFLQNFSKPFYGFFWESWSLSIEEWFYILFPLILLVTHFIFVPKRSFLISALILVILPLIYRIKISGQTVDSFWWDVTFRKMVLTRLDTIGYGIFAAWIKFYYPELWKRSRIILFISGLIIMILTLYTDRQPNDFYYKTFYFCVTSFAAMLLLPLAESLRSFKGNAGKFITHISLVSYSMYLINMAVVAEVISKNFPAVNQQDSLMKYVLYWIIVFIASTLLYKYFEKPVMDLRGKKISGITKYSGN